MDSHRAWTRWTPFPACIGLLIVLSCGDDGPSAPQSDAHGADSLVVLANAALERVLYEELNPPDPTRPADVDFTEPYGLYQQALALDAANKHANLGAGITGLLVLSTDAEVNAAFDEWKAYLDAHTPFEVPGGTHAALGVTLGLPSARDALRLPFDLVTLSVLAQARTSLLAADPQIGRVQAILRDRALPRLVVALQRLQVPAADPSYTFTVTPRMQGDEFASPAEIDQTDVLATRAGCSLLVAAIRVAVSYNLGFAAYDSTTLVNSLARGSGWLTLAAGGRDYMAAARTALLEAVDDVDQAITALRNEVDSQNDDVIKIGPDDLSQADVDSIQANLPTVRQGLTSGYTRVDDWDGNDLTPDEPLTIHLGNLLTDPPQDWKALLPDYTVTTERRGQGSGSCLYVDGAATVGVVAPDSAGWVSSQLSDSGGGNRIFYGPEFLRAPIEQVLDQALAGVELPACLDWFGASAYFYGYLGAPGAHDITVSWYINFCAAEACVVVPVIEWQAASFATWVWPDPTLAGLLPQVPSSSELMRIFGVTANDWEPRWVLDWTN